MPLITEPAPLEPEGLFAGFSGAAIGARDDERWFVARAVLSVALAVFTGEVATMAALEARVPPVSASMAALVDACVLVALTIPAVLFAVVLPMRRRIAMQVAELEANVDRLAWLSRAFRSVEDALLVTDGAARVVTMNPAFLRLTGLRFEAVVGLEVRELARLGSRVDPNVFRRIAEGVAWRGRFVNEGSSTDALELCTTISPIDASDGPAMGSVAVLRDLREQLAHERRLAQLLEEQRCISHELEKARELAAEASQTKSRFVAAMSHEIRTPLAGMLGTLELLEVQLARREDKDLAAVARDASHALLEVLNGVLDFSKAEAGRLELERVPFDVAAVLRGVASLFGAKAQELGLELALEKPNGPLWVLGDPTKLRQVLANLVGNALKFTRTGSVTLCLETAGGGGGRLALSFSVRDTGVGISPRAREKLFKPFAQGDASISRTHGGTGLGLAICVSLVQSMGGILEVESEEGVGSRFFFTLPFSAATPPPLAAVPVTSDADKAKLAGVRVLLAEDNPVLRLIVSKALQRLRCVVTLAHDGAEALAALSSGPAQDVVLMDCQMPALDGLEATARIRASETPHSRVPIVALTANCQDADREACFRAGMNAFLVKPVKEAELVSTLRDVLKLGGGEGGCVG